LQTLQEKEKILSKEDPKIFQKVNPDPLHSISKSAKVTLIVNQIRQDGFVKSISHQL
jgi:hypothetical protein